MDTLVAFIVAVIVIGLFMRSYLKKQKRIEELALAAEEKGKLRSDGPQSQHPHIDANNCIGCAACTMVCPEGDVLAMLGGKAVIVNGYKRSEEHTSELQSQSNLVCRLLLEKKKLNRLRYHQILSSM